MTQAPQKQLLCGDVHTAINGSLVDTVSVQFDFPSLWADVILLCKSLLEWETSPEVSTLQGSTDVITRAYTLVYHIVAHPCSDLPQVIVDGEPVTKGCQIIVVFNELKQLIEKHLSQKVFPAFSAIASKANEYEVVKTYVRLWRSYLVSVVSIRAVFSSLSPTWNTFATNSDPFDCTEDMAFEKWSNIIISSEEERLKKEFYHIVDADRNGCGTPDEAIFAVEVKEALTMLPEASIYKRIIEQDYIKHTCDFYKGRTSKLLERGIFQYAVECLRYVAEESARASKFLRSKRDVIDRLIGVLVDDRLEDFSSMGFSSWLMECYDSKAVDQANAVYTLLAYSRDWGLPLLGELCTRGIAQRTVDLMKPCVAGTGDEACESIIRCFARIVQDVKAFAAEAFEDDGSMMEALEDGLREGLQLSIGKSVSYKQLAECLAAISCSVFERNQSSDGYAASDPTKMSLEDMVNVFFFLPDTDLSAKDVFLASYQKHLARRLLSKQFDEALEQSAFDLLAQVKQGVTLFCCRSMLKAATTRRIYASVPNSSEQDSDGGLVTNMILLSKGTWPAVPLCDNSMIPESLRESVARAYASAKNREGQKAELSAYSYGQVRVRLPNSSGGAVDVHLQLSLVQLRIVLCFNDAAEWVLEKLCGAVGVPPLECITAITPLVRGTILECTMPFNKGTVICTGPCNAVPAAGVVNLIPAYVTGVRSCTGETEQNSNSFSDQRRSALLECLIIKLMKRKGTQTLDDIFAEANIVHSTDPIALSDVKKCLEKLISRNFVERLEDGKTFSYLP